MSDIQAIGGAGSAIEALLTYTTNTGERVVYHITETSEDEDNPVILERHAVHQMPIHDLRAVADGLSLDREASSCAARRRRSPISMTRTR